MSTAPQVVSLDWGNFESGGMVSNTNVRIKEARYVIWAYPGGTTPAGIFVKLTMDLLASPGGEVVSEGDQHLSFGKKEYFTISEDGKLLIPGEMSAPKSKTAFHGFMGSLVMANGMPGNWLANGDISRLEGLEFYAASIKVPKIDGSGDGNQFIAAPQSVNRAPWDAAKAGTSKAAGKAKGAAVAPAAGAAAVAAPAPAAEASSDEDSEAAAVALIQQYIGGAGEAGGPNPQSKALKLVTTGVQLTAPFSKDPSWSSAYKHLKTPALVAALMERVGADNGLVVVGDGAARVIQQVTE